MVRLIGVGFAALLSPALFAQHVGVINTGPSLQPAPGAYRYGNILFPGGSGHASNLGSTITGPGYTGVPQGRPGVGPGRPGGGPGGRGGGRQQTIVVPYAYPVYFGDPYGYQQQQPQNVTVVVPPTPTPQVIINQGYVPDTANPVLRDYSDQPLPESRPRSGMRVYEAPTPGRLDEQSTAAEPAPGPAPAARKPVIRAEASDQPNIYLIAMKDGTVHTAIGYWISKGTLHYVTPQSVINRVTMDQVDKELSERLNSERNLEFSLKQ